MWCWGAVNEPLCVCLHTRSPSPPPLTSSALFCAVSQELNELKDQIQDVEGRYIQGLKEMKVPASRVWARAINPTGLPGAPGAPWRVHAHSTEAAGREEVPLQFSTHLLGAWSLTAPLHVLCSLPTPALGHLRTGQGSLHVQWLRPGAPPLPTSHTACLLPPRKAGV